MTGAPPVVHSAEQYAENLEAHLAAYVAGYEACMKRGKEALIAGRTGTGPADSQTIYAQAREWQVRVDAVSSVLRSMDEYPAVAR